MSQKDSVTAGTLLAVPVTVLVMKSPVAAGRNSHATNDRFLLLVPATRWRSIQPDADSLQIVARGRIALHHLGVVAGYHHLDAAVGQLLQLVVARQHVGDRVDDREQL